MDRKNRIWVFILIAVLSWLLYATTLMICVKIEPSDPGLSWAIRGQFGDMFGAFSALITALGFAGVLYTIRQQRNDSLRQYRFLQREELRSALTAQLNALIQIQSLPDELRVATWGAIASASGGPGPEFPIERAIAIQIEYLDGLADPNSSIESIPTYGRQLRGS